MDWCRRCGNSACVFPASKASKASQVGWYVEREFEKFRKKEGVKLSLWYHERELDDRMGRRNGQIG